MNYHNILHDNMANGDGLRVILFVAGCSHHCKGCHNPETWDEKSGILFDEAAKKEIFDQLEKDYIEGITFSGGDPLYCNNRETITSLCKEIKEKFPEKTIWLYTGFTYDEVKDLEIIKYLDVLCDGEFIESLKSPDKEWVGSANQNVIHLSKKVASIS